MNEIFSVEDFQTYLIEKEVPDTCPCCQRDDVIYSAVGLPKRAKIEDEATGRVTFDTNADNNAGLGLVETVVSQEGKVTDIRFGAHPVFLIRCNHCGFMRTFDARFVQKEYHRIMQEKLNGNDVK
ncbi:MULTISPECIES: hypothetical protein [unclassified Mannheimia]|uniref:hypothetical protein n=1 Tax=unclassified Mannheimia TaxID=2645054 RepID=UPI00359D3698